MEKDICNCNKSNDLKEANKKFEMALYDIIYNAKSRNCIGCPLHGTGVIKYGSCKTRLMDYYKYNRNTDLLNEMYSKIVSSNESGVD
jgi:hypothetical protein